MNAGVEFVKKPVRFICIFLGSGVWSRRKISLSHIEVEATYGLIFVFEEAHCILNDDLIVNANKFYDFFGYPRSNHHYVYFPHINLYTITEVLYKLDR